ncbi:apolipoprotein N-acyltransferase [Neptunicella sp. SCSIO 80796]|uniref:apolipoprotein N-acyltransferase n=1 Tax=Neptunicella plasticusilytica TaxID=3117012 RepID=UPI003A4E044D
MIIYLLALLCGVSLTLSYAPFSQWYLMPMALSLFCWLLNRHDIKRGWLGWWFGLGWFGAGISWVHVSIAQYGGLPIVLSLGMMLLLCGYLAIYPALFGKLLQRFFQPRYWPLAAPALWLLCEGLRGWVLTGFPWLSLGYSQIDGPLAGWIPVIGEVGVSALLIMLASSAAIWLPHKRYIPVAALWLTCLFGGLVLNQVDWANSYKPAVKISMVQGNIHQSMRWVPEQDWPTMMKYRHITDGLWDSDIVIWPEAAIPKLEPLALDYLHDLDSAAAQNHTGLITGILNYHFETSEAYNGIISLGSIDRQDEQGQYRYDHANRYAKHHLLPIGEFIPLEKWLRGLAPIFDLPMSSFSRGDYLQTNLQSNGYHLAPALCYEIVLPEQIRDNLHADTDFILTLSNDAWFGDSHGPHQHLEIARVRAKEFALPVLRATNNGISAFIDHQGNIISKAPQFVETSLSAEVENVISNTPYRRFGNWIIWLICLAGLAVALVLKRQH